MNCQGKTTYLKSGCRKNQLGCPCPKNGNPTLNSLGMVIDCYISRFRIGNCPPPSDEEHHFKSQPTLVDAIQAAGMAERGQDRKRHSHQYRIGEPDLKAWTKVLLDQQTSIDQCNSFDRLHQHLTHSKTAGIGRLTIYDTALRIGYFKKVYPTDVYLHAGTAYGAAVFGNWAGREKLSVQELPSEVARLKPHQIEDFCCVCKNQLHWLRGKGLL